MPSSSHCRATESRSCSGSTSNRLASIGISDFFFEPVEFELELADLLVQPILELTV
jgi:hypothetical protein